MHCLKKPRLSNERRGFFISGHGGSAMRNAAIIIFCVLFACIQAISTFAGERRVGLVIGNAGYEKMPLRNPVNDANDIAKVLGELGFDVILKTDANQKVMEQSIQYLGRELLSGGVGLFYYAGHAIQYQGRNYMIPLHSDIKTEADVKYEAVDAGRVLAQMEQAENSLNIIILDSCRTNPFVRSFRNAEQGLAKMDAPAGSILAYATAPGSVAADGSGRNGLYTSILLKYMRTPGMNLHELFMKVRRDIRYESNKMQTPWESTSLTRHFYFNPLERDIVLDVDPKEVNPKEIVARDGKIVKYANDVVYDKETNLEWYAGPDKQTSWYEAKKWVRSLNFDGGGWRMPTKYELSTLFELGVGTRNMTPLLFTTGWSVWSGESKDSSMVWYYHFVNGVEAYTGPAPPIDYTRCFAVRSRK
jgi:hypothetical protein